MKHTGITISSSSSSSFKDWASWPVPVSELIFLKLMNLSGQLVGLLGRGIGPTQGLYPHTGQHNTEKRGHTSMPRVGFEPTIPVFERQKTVRASDRSSIGTSFMSTRVYPKVSGPSR
jgi:hypothetical protein